MVLITFRCNSTNWQNLSDLAKLPFFFTNNAILNPLGFKMSYSYHRIPLRNIFVALALTLAKVLLKRLRKTRWNFKTQLNMFLDILEPKAQN